MKENGWIKVRLDRKISIMTESVSRTTSGASDISHPSVLASVFARVRYVTRTQKEQMYGGRETSIQEVHFDIRYRSDLDKVKMVDYEGGRYDIITIMERGRKQYQTLVTQWKDSEIAV